MPRDPNGYLAWLRASVESAIHEQLSSACGPLAPAMRHCLLSGGKRLRPVLCVAVAEALGAETRASLPTAVAIELIHTMTLVHDDLPAMDNAMWRRGTRTTHSLYGEALAILAGDALLVHAFEAVAGTKGVPAERLIRVITRLTRCAGVEGLAGGQATELIAAGRYDFSKAEIDRMYDLKTGSLFSAALATGALIAGADDGTLEALDRTGYSLGRAFQVLDDIGDAVGSRELLGKDVGNDQKAGRVNYVTVLGLSEAVRQARLLLKEVVTGCTVGDEISSLINAICSEAGHIIDQGTASTSHPLP